MEVLMQHLDTGALSLSHPLPDYPLTGIGSTGSILPRPGYAPLPRVIPTTYAVAGFAEVYA